MTQEMAQNPQEQIAAYSNAACNATKVRQVVMLYDAVIRTMYQVKTAIEENEVEVRFNALQKAANIILGLQGSLDFERGKEISKLLDGYYSSIDMRILNMHRNPDMAVCEQVIKELKMMRDAWVDVDQQSSVEAADDESIDIADIPPSSAESISNLCVSV